MTTEGAKARIRLVASTKRDANAPYRSPLCLTIFSSLSYALIVFGWGMTEKENLWSLGMYIGAGGFFLATALSFYASLPLRTKGRRVAKTKADIAFSFMQLVFFALLLFGGRLVRFSGFEFGPHVAALISGIFIGYLQLKHPGAEHVKKESGHS